MSLIHFELCLFLFFVKNVNFDQFWKNHKFQKSANFRIKTEPNVFFLSYLEENIPINGFPWKKNQIYITFTYKWSYLFKNSKFSGKFRKLLRIITSEPIMLETWNLHRKCVVLDTLLYSTNNSISTKSGFRPSWKWALHLSSYTWIGENQKLVRNLLTRTDDGVTLILFCIGTLARGSTKRVACSSP